MIDQLTPNNSLLAQDKDTNYTSDLHSVSFFPLGITQITGGEERSCKDLLYDIKSGRWKVQVQKIRQTSDDTAHRELKKQLPYFTASGTFKKRGEKGILQHSGIVALDIDHDISQRAKIEVDPFTYSCFISAGGNGLAVLIRIPIEHHAASYEALKKYYWEEYGIKVDSLPDVSRARFVSYDPVLYINPKSAVFEETISNEKPKPAPQMPPLKATHQYRSLNSINHGQIALQTAIRKINEAAPGEKHHTRKRMSYLCGGYVATGFLNQFEATQALKQTVMQTSPESAWNDAFKTIDSGIAKGQEKPIMPDFFQQMIYGSKKKDVPKEVIAHKISAVTGHDLAVILSAVSAVYAEEDLVFETFWHVVYDEKKHKHTIFISEQKFLEFLNTSGFWQLKINGVNQIVQVQEKAVKLADGSMIKRFVLEYLESLPFAFDGILRSEMLDKYLKQSLRLCKDDFLENLPFLTDPFVKSDVEHSYYYFQNGFAVVTKNKIEYLDYNKLPGLIWESKIIKRDFSVVPASEIDQADFFIFCQKVTGEDIELIEVLMHAIGYLMHSHRSRRHYAAIILSDQNGRTGKGIIGQALSHFKTVTKIDGRNVDLNRPFALQRVSESTDIVFVDDADPKRFPLERIYSWLTDGIEVEQKGRTAFEIPFENAPKFLIASNFVFDGRTASHEARKVEIEFDNYFNVEWTVADEFGRELFNGWPAEEWLLFDNFMLHCCQLYLAHGIKRYKSESLQTKKLIQATSEDFATWADNAITGLAIGSELDKKELWYDFLSFSGLTDKTHSQAKHTGWIKQYLNRMGYTFKDGQNRSLINGIEVLRITTLPERPTF